jgi:hypothetical protein
MLKQYLSFIRLSDTKAINLFMIVVADTIVHEYQETKDATETCSTIFKVFYELHAEDKKKEVLPMFDKGDVAERFYQAFENKMTQDIELYKQDPAFAKIIDTNFSNMKRLSQAIKSVNYSKNQMSENLFYRAYCMTQLIEMLWELKLFKLFLDNREAFESLNTKMGNNLEVAFTYLRFLESMDNQADEDKIMIGQKEIYAHIQLMNLKRVQKFFEKAEFFEKAIEILNR